MEEELEAEARDVADAAVSSIGTRLRQLRATRGIGLRALARRVGVTPSMLSQIESGAAKPSVGTLFRLAAALDTTADYFFQRDDATPLSVGPMVPRDARARIELSAGIVWERLTPTDEHDFEFMQCTYPPGAVSAPEMQQHPGRDYGILIEGELDISLGFASYRLWPGDAIAFDASVPHRFSNPGPGVARTIWVILDRNVPPTLDDPVRRRRRPDRTAARSFSS